MFKFIDRAFNIVLKMMKWVAVIAILLFIAFITGTISYMG